MLTNTSFRTLRKVKQQGVLNEFSTVIIKDKQNQKLVLKRYIGKKVLLFKLLTREARVLRWLNKNALSKNLSDIHIPQLISEYRTKTEITILRQYIKGKTLRCFDIKTQLEIFLRCDTYFKNIPISRTADIKHIIVTKNQLYILFCFIFYYLRVLVKRNVINYQLFRLSIKFFLLSLGSILSPTHYSLTHGDLSLDNIIYDSRQKKITIIDFSDVAVAEKETDLVIFSEYNHQLYSLKRFLSFIKSEITTPNSRKAFVKLAIFYLFQTLSSEDKQSYFYQNAVKYTDTLLYKIIPLIQTK